MNPKRSAIWILATVLSLAPQLKTGAQVILSFDPPFGTTNEQVVINGSGFAPGTLVVRFNGALDTSARATSPHTIYARVPAGASTGPITVQVNSSVASSLADFTVLGLGPYLTFFEPPYGMVNDQVRIYGWHLTNATAVKFGNKASLSFLPNAAGSQITAIVPPGATNGPITVSTIYGTSNTMESFTVIGPGPYVAGFEPAVGNAGDTISIFGTNFVSATGVHFAGRPGVNFFVQATGLIQVRAPAGVVTGPITVLSPQGNFTTATNFFVPPSVTGFSPVSGRAGTNIQVRGQNLLQALAVTIGGVPAASMVATNNTNVFITLPTGVRTGPVRVNTPAGSAQSISNLTIPPVVTGFAPAFGGPGASVVVSGANLNEGEPTVKFGSINATVTQVRFDSLTVLVPAGASTGPIMVTTTNGSFTTATNFSLPPEVFGFSPTNSAPGTSVLISGTNLLGATSVTFNGLGAQFNLPTNNSTLVAVVPLEVTTGPISVTTAGGTAVRGTFYGPPRIDNFAPAHGLPGTWVTITGTNFQQATAVAFGQVQAPGFTVTNNGGEIRVRVPTNAVSSGKISVTGPAGLGVSAATFVIDFENRLNLTLLASPNPVFVSSNLVYTYVLLNGGPSPAPNVVLESLLPESLQVKSYTSSQGTTNLANRMFRAQLGQIAVSNSATVTLTVSPQEPGPLTLSGTMFSDYADPDPDDNTAAATITVLPLPVLSISPYSQKQWLLSWPVSLTNFSLQYRERLASTSPWLQLSTSPSIVGTNYIVIEAATEDTRFYRLKQ